MKKKNYLIFDFGASSGRGAVAEFDGEQFDLKVIHRFDNRPVSADKTLYWDILRLFSELKIGTQLAAKTYENSISSLGIDTWGVDFGFIDKNGKLISNPIHYRDKSRNSVGEELFRIIPERELFNLTGGQLVSEVSLFNMFHLKNSDAPELTCASKFLMTPDIFNYFLTGIVSNEFTMATTTLMFNQKEKKWQEKILEKLNIPKEIFNDVIDPGTKIGNITDYVCEDLGIKTIPIIAPATHDTASAVTGIPVTSKNKKWAFISIGTWCTLGKPE